ncbi:hypothetical protein M405DRAFT_585995 [Rhizopogon salebrosus TDB-379]|nr:hypothetical protein M405DRAFT_585995 [Rhizopogon salebrosus TDB-379]
MTSVRDQQTYALTNCQGGTVLDLSGTDHYSIIGYQYHSGTNQQWTFVRADNLWYIMSYGSGQYLGIEGDISNAQNGTKVVAVTWGVEDSDISGIQGIRVLVHGTNFSLDLNGGNSADSSFGKGGKVPIRFGPSARSRK